MIKLTTKNFTTKTIEIVDGNNVLHKFKNVPPRISYLLGTNSDAKTVKGIKYGFMTGIQYLAPSDVSGIVNLCPKASDGCRIACLFTAGRAETMPDSIQPARINRTIWFVRHKPQYWQRLVKEIKSLEIKAKNKNLIPVIRLNGTSDILYERIKIKGTEFDGLTIFEAFPHIQFYDYSKYEYSERENIPSNYHLTYSYSENTTQEILSDNLTNGRNVAIVFNVCKFDNKKQCYKKCNCELPESWNGYQVISGDDSDVRFLDPQGVIVGLKAKGKARFDQSGFVVKVGA